MDFLLAVVGVFAKGRRHKVFNQEDGDAWTLYLSVAYLEFYFGWYFVDYLKSRPVAAYDVFVVYTHRRQGVNDYFIVRIQDRLIPLWQMVYALKAAFLAYTAFIPVFSWKMVFLLGLVNSLTFLAVVLFIPIGQPYKFWHGRYMMVDFVSVIAFLLRVVSHPDVRDMLVFAWSFILGINLAVSLVHGYFQQLFLDRRWPSWTSFEGLMQLVDELTDHHLLSTTRDLYFSGALVSLVSSFIPSLRFRFAATLGSSFIFAVVTYILQFDRNDAVARLPLKRNVKEQINEKWVLRVVALFAYYISLYTAGVQGYMLRYHPSTRFPVWTRFPTIVIGLSLIHEVRRRASSYHFGDDVTLLFLRACWLFSWCAGNLWFSAFVKAKLMLSALSFICALMGYVVCIGRGQRYAQGQRYWHHHHLFVISILLTSFGLQLQLVLRDQGANSPEFPEILNQYTFLEKLSMLTYRECYERLSKDPLIREHGLAPSLDTLRQYTELILRMLAWPS